MFLEGNSFTPTGRQGSECPVPPKQKRCHHDMNYAFRMKRDVKRNVANLRTSHCSKTDNCTFGKKSKQQENFDFMVFGSQLLNMQ